MNDQELYEMKISDAGAAGRWDASLALRDVEDALLAANNLRDILDKRLSLVELARLILDESHRRRCEKLAGSEEE